MSGTAGSGEGAGSGSAAPKAKTKVAVSYDKFQAVAQTLAMHLQQREAQARAGGVEEGEAREQAGMRQVDLVRWYVQRQNAGGEFESVDAVVAEYRLVRQIIQRLIAKEGMLTVVDDGSAAMRSAQAEQEEEVRKAVAEGRDPPQPKPLPTGVDVRLLALSPNYVVD